MLKTKEARNLLRSSVASRVDRSDQKINAYKFFFTSGEAVIDKIQNLSRERSSTLASNASVRFRGIR